MAERDLVLNIETSFWSRLILFLKFEFGFGLSSGVKRMWHKTQFPKFYRDLCIFLTVFPALMYVSMNSAYILTKWSPLAFFLLAIFFEYQKRYYDGKYKAFYRKKYGLRGESNVHVWKKQTESE